jgi:hypothetical protein
MPRITNAFKFRAADRAVLDTTLFLNLYSPTLLDQLRPDDLLIPKLLVLRGSPGSGKSTLLRLFETETLLALHTRKAHPHNQALITELTDLDVLSADGINAFGIYVHCDSSLRDIANLDVNGANAKLLNTMIDVRITSGYLRALQLILHAGLLPDRFLKTYLNPLPSRENGPPLFNKAHTIDSLAAECERIEADFATLLNSFPGDPIPPSIQPHARVFSITYLSCQKDSLPDLSGLLPVIMLDDLHELYEAQRDQIRHEFLQRAAIPRWVAIRKHVYELEELISLEGATDDRDFREIDLDSASPSIFRKFVANVASRRMQQSSALQQYNVNDFRIQLRDAETSIKRSKVENEIQELSTRLKALTRTQEIPTQQISEEEEIPVELLANLEGQLLMAERQASRRQQVMFPELEPHEPQDAKTQEAARLFAAQRFRLPYYHSFDTLSDASNGNVEQFLSIASVLADKMIFRAELGRDLSLSAQEQHDLLRRSANTYYNDLEQRFDRGYAIRQLVDNLAVFFHAVTYRPTAPIAPGVNGFGLPREQLRSVLTARGEDDDIIAFRDVLTSAVAGNVIFVRLTRQGQAGAEKIVFYLNRLLCVKYNLPLNTGGWQTLSIDTLIKMMKGMVPAKEWGKRWVAQPFELRGVEE